MFFKKVCLRSIYYIIPLDEVLDQVKLIYGERDYQNSGSLSGGRRGDSLGRARRKFSGENILYFDRVMAFVKTHVTVPLKIFI